jgi:hypothetical protein
MEWEVPKITESSSMISIDIVGERFPPLPPIAEVVRLRVPVAFAEDALVALCFLDLESCITLSAFEVARDLIVLLLTTAFIIELVLALLCASAVCADKTSHLSKSIKIILNNSHVSSTSIVSIIR